MTDTAASGVIADIRAVLRAIGHVLRNDAAHARAAAPDNNRALIVSFIALFISYVVEWWLNILLDPQGRLELVEPGLSGELAALALLLLIWVGVTALFAWLYGRLRLLRRYFTTANWLTAITEPFFTLLILGTNAIAGEPAAMMVVLVTLVLILWIIVRTARILLDITTARAIVLLIALLIAIFTLLILVGGISLTD